MGDVMRAVLALILLSVSLPIGAAQVTVEGVRLWTAPDHTRLVFDVSGPVDHELFTLKAPERLVIDLAKARPDASLDTTSLHDRHLHGVRYANRKGGDLRLVLDLKQSVRPKSFLLKPNGPYGHRLVLDLYDVESGNSKPTVKTVADSGRPRDVIVAIDAGHGGEDSGAIGKTYRTYEKDVVLAVAKRLARLIDAQSGMKAVLVRKGDYFIPLRKRMEIARKQRADLFVSIHADAFHDRRVRGSSVYVLSRRGASSEAARWLAESENSADLVGGVSLDDKDDVLASVLLDLSQSATRQMSVEVASDVYRELKRHGKVHGRKVQQAGFAVLKSPDIPSMLVETAFISNPTEERNLRNPKYQESLARALLRGVQGYFKKAPPPGTLLASLQQQDEREHVIAPGDTLSTIAQNYRISLLELKRENRLKGDVIRVGQVLRIPNS